MSLFGSKLDGLTLCVGSDIKEYSNKLTLTVSFKNSNKLIATSSKTIEYNQYLTSDGYLVEEELESLFDTLIWSLIEMLKI